MNGPAALRPRRKAHLLACAALLSVMAGTAGAAALGVALDGLLTRVPLPARSAAEAFQRNQDGGDRMVAPVSRDIAATQARAQQATTNRVAGMAGMPGGMNPGARAPTNQAEAMAMAMAMAAQMSGQAAAGAIPDPASMQTVQACMGDVSTDPAANNAAQALTASAQRFRNELDRIQMQEQEREATCDSRPNQQSLTCRNAIRAPARATAMRAADGFLAEMTPRLAQVRTDLQGDIGRCGAAAARIANLGGAVGGQGETIEQMLLGRIGRLAEFTADLTITAAEADILQPETTP